MSTVYFVDDKETEQYLCAICQDVMTNPSQIGCGGSHVFCKECVNQLISSNGPKCPMCNTPFATNSLMEIAFIQRQINELKVKCPNHIITIANSDDANDNDNDEQYLIKHDANNNISNAANNKRRSLRLKIKNINKWKEEEKNKKADKENTNSNNRSRKRKLSIVNDPSQPKAKRQKLNEAECCDWIGSFGDLKNHMNTCPFELIHCECSANGCKHKIKRKYMTSHVNICGYVPIVCPQCEIQTMRGHLSSHLSDVCCLRTVSCDANGCDAKMKRKDMDNHQKHECNYTMIQCEYMKYGCDICFYRNDKQRHHKEFMQHHLELIKQGYHKLEKENGILKKQMNQNRQPFLSHMSSSEANRLQIHDKIDHRDDVGRYVYATVEDKQGTNLKIHYDGWNRKWDTWSDFSIGIHRFALARSISKRPAHRFVQLKNGDQIDINPIHFHYQNSAHHGWKCGTILRFDKESGQIQVRYKHNDKYFHYWTHLDNTNEIRSAVIH